jgi:biopolymer transport protein ExbB/TolQ
MTDKQQSMKQLQSVFANPGVGSFVILAISNILLYAARRHAKGVQNRKLAEAFEEERQLKEQQESVKEQQESVKEQREFEEFKKWKKCLIL